MDILAARKKAAERAKAGTHPEPDHPAEVKPAQADEPTPPVETSSEQPAIAAEAPAPESAVTAAAVDAPAGATGTPPVEGPEAIQAREIELLAFRLGGEEYAVMVDDVREVLRNYHLTVVPNAPAHILGIMSLRGTVTTVIDPCKRIGLRPGVRDDKSRIIIVSTEDEDVGLIVDRVTGVVRIAPEDIKPAPENNEQGTEFLRGIARKNDRLYILLDLGRVAGT
jgi:purine-binding chemotaxis protein CheW